MQGGTLSIGVVDEILGVDKIDSIDWNAVTGGTIEITSLCTGCSRFRGEVVLSGGTLEVKADLCSPEGLEFFASTINVADGISAAFATRCGS